MLDFPQTTAPKPRFPLRFPKQKFYEHLDIPAEIRQLFVNQIRLIYWTNVLSPVSLNIAPGEAVEEIDVLKILLQGQELDERVLQLIERQSPRHILFCLQRPDGLCQLYVTYKEASRSGSNAFLLKQSYHTEWMKPEDLSINLTALDMDTLYESIVRQIAGEAITVQGESLKEAVEQTQQREKLEKQIAQLKAKMKKEKQLGRQMKLRREIMRLEVQLFNE